MGASHARGGVPPKLREALGADTVGDERVECLLMHGGRVIRRRVPRAHDTAASAPNLQAISLGVNPIMNILVPTCVIKGARVGGSADRPRDLIISLTPVHVAAEGELGGILPHDMEIEGVDPGGVMERFVSKADPVLRELLHYATDSPPEMFFERWLHPLQRPGNLAVLGVAVERDLMYNIVTDSATHLLAQYTREGESED